jgi:hypothetical protein
LKRPPTNNSMKVSDMCNPASDLSKRRW